jgi:hypothetical protein
MSQPSLTEQRQRLYDCVHGVLNPQRIVVEKYPRDDPIPPVAMIINPRITFPDNSKLGIVEWSIRLYEVRKANQDVAKDFDELLPQLLLPLGKGMGMGYVLDRVENAIMNEMGYTLPGYIVIGNVPLANC